MIDLTGLFWVILTGILVIAISYFLDRAWAATIPFAVVYYAIRLPGVVIHECAHVLGCLVTGAKIRKVVLFSREGGSVSYARPLIPYLGDVIISTAPLFCIPLVLDACTWLFGAYLGCRFPEFPASFNSPDTVRLMGDSLLFIINENFLLRFNGWILAYLYLVTSLVLSVAPSTQDMKNAAIGTGLLILAGALIIWSGIGSVISVLSELIRLIGIGFSLGLVFGIIALAVSAPLVIWYAAGRRT